jgi:hypothetical protein
MEKRSPHRGKTVCRVLSLGALLAAVGIVPAAYATLIPGGGKTAGDCLVELDVAGVEASQITKGKKVECIDGDPCDADHACNGSCTFATAVCILQTDPALADCTAPAALTALTVNAMGGIIIPSPLPRPPDAATRSTPWWPSRAAAEAGKLIVKATAKQASKPKERRRASSARCVRARGRLPHDDASTTRRRRSLPSAATGPSARAACVRRAAPASCGWADLRRHLPVCVAQVAC